MTVLVYSVTIIVAYHMALIIKGLCHFMLIWGLACDNFRHIEC